MPSPPTRQTPVALALVLVVWLCNRPGRRQPDARKGAQWDCQERGGGRQREERAEIVVNPITDTSDLTHTAGAGITELLISRLIAAGVKPVTRGADLIFSGEYALGEAETDGVRQGFPVGRLTFKVKRRNGMTLIDSEAELPERQPRITSPKDLAMMSGQTVFRPPSAPEVENNKKALDAIDNKPGLFVIKGAKIRPPARLMPSKCWWPRHRASRLRVTPRSGRVTWRSATECRSSRSSRARPSRSGLSTTQSTTLPRPSRSTA